MYAVARVAGGCQSPCCNPHRAPLFASANKQDNCAGQRAKGSGKGTETGGSRRESKRGWWTREGFCRFCRCRKKNEPALHHAADSEKGIDVVAGRLFSGLLAGAPQMLAGAPQM